MVVTAVSAQNVKLAIKKDDGDTWTYFKEVRTVPSIGENLATLDATHLESEIHEYIRDIPDQSSELSFEMNAMPSGVDNSNYDLLLSLDKSKSYEFKIEYPQQNVQVTLLADWAWNMGEAAVSTVMSINLSLAPRSAPVWTKLDGAVGLILNPNGGAGAPITTTEKTNTVIVATAPESFSNEGYEIVGWNTMPNGGGVSIDIDKPFTLSKDTTLYAMWGKKTDEEASDEEA